MATKPMYPQTWVPMEFVCPCGVKCRVDIQPINGAFSPQFFQHCDMDEGRDLLPGQAIACWEERGGRWVRFDAPERDAE